MASSCSGLLAYLRRLAWCKDDGSGTTSAHTDASRQAVGKTAFAVCLCRALESSRRDAPPRLRDPVAEALCTPCGPAPLVFRIARLTYRCPWPISAPARRKIGSNIVDVVASRTQQIDEIIENVVGNPSGPKQLVIIGAGLDARVLRLEALSPKASSAQTFEVDFEAMLTEKRRLFALAGYSEWAMAAKPVGTDLCQNAEVWQQALEQAGFDRTKPSVWLLEGLTGYLTDSELRELLAAIVAMLATGSFQIATWLGSSSAHLSMHRTFTNEPDADFMRPLGWVLLEQRAIGTGNDYWLTLHHWVNPT